MKKFKSVIIGVGLAATLAAASLAGAQDAPQGPPPGQPGMEQPGMPSMQPPGGPNGLRGPAGGQGGMHGPRGDRSFGDGLRQVVQAAADETGLAPRVVIEQVMQGSTLAEVITANGGDVQAVIDAAIAAATDRINQAVANGNLAQERADEMLSNLPTVVEQAVNGEFQPGRGEGSGPGRGEIRQGGERALVQAVVEATGLSPQDIMSQLQQGTTLADIVTANGGDIQAVLDTAVASAVERINQAVANGRMTQEQADALIANLSQGLTELMNGDLFAIEAGARAETGVIRLVLEQTGLSGTELRQQLESGATLADVLTANGVSIETFVADATARVTARLNVLVVDGRITQERADELIAQFQSHLNERLNQAGLGMPQGGEGVGV